MSDPRTEALLFLRQVAEGEPEIVLDLPNATESGDVFTSSASLAPDSPEQVQRRSRLAEVGSAASVCTLCDLCKTRNKVVFGVGNPSAQLMFVGEAPGADEDRQGEPFVGRAGQLLTRIIIALGLTRQDVYIANVLKCRPPQNRNPLPHEAASCLPYLRHQIEIISPEVLIALGLVAATNLLNLPNATMKDLRGRIHEFEGKPLIVTYHPAALLRNPAFKAPTWQDVQMAMKVLSGEIPWQPKPKATLL